MLHFDTTSNFINNRATTSAPSVNDIIKTYGYSTAGGAGGARWKATGNVIAVSQDPLTLNDIKLSDASGNEYELVLEEAGIIDLNVLGGTSASYENIAAAAGLTYSQGLTSDISNDIVNIDLISSLTNRPGVSVDQAFSVAEAKSRIYDSVLTSSVIPNDIDIIQSVNDPLISFVARKGNYHLSYETLSDMIADQYLGDGEIATITGEISTNDARETRYYISGSATAKPEDETLSNGNVAVKWLPLRDREIKFNVSSSVEPMSLISHRGFVDIHTQNTIQALSEVALVGQSDFLEVDVQTTSDNIGVLYHDATLDSLTDGTGAVSANTLAQVQAAKFTQNIGTRYEDDRIPTFEEFLDSVMLETGSKCFAEFQLLASESDVTPLLALIQDRDLQDRMIIYTGAGAGTFTRLQTIRGLDNRIGLGATAELYTTAEIDNVATLGGNLYYLMQHTLATQALVDYCKALDIEPVAWTPDFQSDLLPMRDLGISYIFCDRTPGGLKPQQQQFTQRAIDPIFGTTSWTRNLTGSGAVTYNSSLDVLNCSANATDRARVDWNRFNVGGGATCRLTVRARKVSGAGVAEITMGGALGTIAKAQPDSAEWKTYTIEYTAPSNLETEDVFLIMGSQIGQDVVCEFSKPVLEVSNDRYAPDGVIARGVILVDNGTGSMSFTSNYASYGLILGTQSSTGVFDISLDGTFDFTTQKPFVEVLALARNAADPDLKASHFGLSGTTDGSFQVLLVRTDTGARYDPTGDTFDAQFQVIVRV